MRAGVEATGVVEKVGPGVHHVIPGARVSVFPHPGAWAERITADAQFVVPVPDSVTDEHRRPDASQSSDSAYVAP